MISKNYHLPQVQLPKFRQQSTHANLVTVLGKLGLSEMFDRRRADFTGLAVTRPVGIQASGVPATGLYVSRVAQKAIIQVSSAWLAFDHFYLFFRPDINQTKFLS